MHILLIRPGALGDVILTLPVVQALDSLTVENTIEMMGNPAVLGLLCGRSAVQAVHAFDALDILPMFQAGAALAPSVRDQFGSYDAILNYAGAPDSVFAGNLGRVARGKVIHCDPRPAASSAVHISRLLQQPLQALGAALCTDPPRLRLTLEDRRAAAAWWAELEIDDRPAVALHPGSGSAPKNWPADRFAAVARHVVAAGLQVLLLSGPADAEAANMVQHGLEGVPCTPVADLPLGLVAAILGRCAAYVGNDSGISHLAAAVGLPVVAIFGPTDPTVWAPQGKMVTVLRGCGSAEELCKEQRYAVTDVTVERVIGALREKTTLPVP